MTLQEMPSELQQLIGRFRSKKGSATRLYNARGGSMDEQADRIHRADEYRNEGLEISGQIINYCEIHGIDYKKDVESHVLAPTRD